MKNKMLKLLCIAAAMLPAMLSAQTYQNDYTSYYSHPTDAMTNNAIYRDPAANVYYIAQQPSSTGQIMITMADQDFNILNTFKYTSLTSNNYLTILDMDEVVSSQQLAIVGTYIMEGAGQQGSFIMCVDKPSGAFQWFKTFPDIERLTACVTHTTAGGGSSNIIAVGYRHGSNYAYSITDRSGVIISVDASNGSVNWARDVEDNKYQGNTISVNGVVNRLSDITKIDDNTFAATGVVNEPDWGNTSVSYFDGDAALVVFDASGTIIKQIALGDPNGLLSSPRPFLFKKGEAITYDPADGTVVIAGNTVENYVNPVGGGCPFPTTVSGLWATKVDLSTYTTNWSVIYNYYSNAYSAHVYYESVNMHIINDNAGNYAISFYNFFDVGVGGTTTYTGNQEIMKLEPTAGGLIYCRGYSGPTNDVVINNLSSSITSNDVIGIGTLMSTPGNTGWNVEAFDHITNYCLSYDFPVNHNTDSYDQLTIASQTFSPSQGSVDFDKDAESLTHTDICPKVYVGPKSSNNQQTVVASVAKTEIRFEPVSNTIAVAVPDGQSYHGTLINALGQVIMKFDNVQNNYTVTLSNVAAGVYYINLSNENNKIAKTISVQ